MLELQGLTAGFGRADVLHGVDLTVAAGEVLALLGRNGAGKTTTLRATMGLLDRCTGSVRVAGADISALAAHLRPAAGLAYVPQGRRLFAQLTVEENLRMGLLVRGADAARRRAWVLELFPALRGRLRTLAGNLSGGEQQMVAMGRALATGPSVLLLDEPGEGLMPAMVERVLDTIDELRRHGVALLLVEQKVELALRIADRIAFIENGRIRDHATPAALAVDPSLLGRYVGVRRRPGGP